MELICNELSFYPIAKSNNEAETRFKELFVSFKEANSAFGFKTIKFHSNFSEQKITPDKTFYEWISTIENSKLKNLILSFFRKPFADDLEDDELDLFLKSDYLITDDNVPAGENPLGLPISHIKSTITLSFNSDIFWQKRKINLLKTNTSETENLIFTAYNICLKTDVNEDEIIEWVDKTMSNTIDSKEMIIKYLSYSKYEIILTEKFLNELFDWKKNNIALFKKILLLMKDVEIHPFTGGLGQTENLRYHGKEASKRITYADRLSYFLDNNTVTFVACKEHYSFH